MYIYPNLFYYFPLSKVLRKIYIENVGDHSALNDNETLATKQQKSHKDG